MMLSWAASALAAWIGAVFGSFANVLIHRLPKGQSIIYPASRCPKCGKPVAFYDNVPVLSWLLLRGRCRCCRAPISARYPAVELLMAAMGWALWQRWGGRPAWAVLTLVAACALVAITFIDWEHFIIPDELSIGLLLLGLCASPLNPLFAGMPVAKALLYSARAACVGFALCYATAAAGTAVFGKEAMGGGDIKLLAAAGAWAGGVGAFNCLMIGSLLGSVYGVALMARGRVKRSDPIPFGPFLSVAALLNLFIVLPLGFPFVGVTS